MSTPNYETAIHGPSTMRLALLLPILLSVTNDKKPIYLNGLFSFENQASWAKNKH